MPMLEVPIKQTTAKPPATEKKVHPSQTPEAAKVANHNHRQRVKKEESQQKAVDDITKENITLRELNVELECDVELRDNEIARLKKQADGADSERLVIISVDRTGRPVFELEGTWNVRDINRLIRPFIVAVRQHATGDTGEEAAPKINSEAAAELETVNSEIDDGTRNPDGTMKIE